LLNYRTPFPPLEKKETRPPLWGELHLRELPNTNPSHEIPKLAGYLLSSVEWRALPPAHTSLASPEPPRSTLDLDRGYYGEAPVRLRGGPQDFPVQGWRNTWLKGRLFREASWVRMGRRDAGNGQTAGAGGPAWHPESRRLLQASREVWLVC